MGCWPAPILVALQSTLTGGTSTFASVVVRFHRRAACFCVSGFSLAPLPSPCIASDNYPRCEFGGMVAPLWDRSAHLSRGVRSVCFFCASRLCAQSFRSVARMLRQQRSQWPGDCRSDRSQEGRSSGLAPVAAQECDRVGCNVGQAC